MLFYPVWRPQDETHLSVEKAKFQVILPAGINFRHKAVNLTAKPEVTTVDKNKMYTWQVANLAAVEEIPFQPSFAEICANRYIPPQLILKLKALKAT